MSVNRDEISFTEKERGQREMGRAGRKREGKIE